MAKLGLLIASFEKVMARSEYLTVSCSILIQLRLVFLVEQRIKRARILTDELEESSDRRKL
jgi:hypothetical protein